MQVNLACPLGIWSIFFFEKQFAIHVLINGYAMLSKENDKLLCQTYTKKKKKNQPNKQTNKNKTKQNKTKKKHVGCFKCHQSHWKKI